MGVDTPEWAVRGHTGGFWSLVGVSWRGGKGTRVGADEAEEPDEDIVVHLKPSIFLQISVTDASRTELITSSGHGYTRKIMYTGSNKRYITRPGLC